MGYCLDSGAVRSIVGLSKYRALFSEVGRKLKIRPSQILIKFGQSRFASTGRFVTRLRVSPDSFLEFVIEVMDGDFPLMIGLEIMITYELHLDLGKHELSDSTGEWQITIH